LFLARKKKKKRNYPGRAYPEKRVDPAFDEGEKGGKKEEVSIFPVGSGNTRRNFREDKGKKGAPYRGALAG